jgi:hypothetical protein
VIRAIARLLAAVILVRALKTGLRTDGRQASTPPR